MRRLVSRALTPRPAKPQRLIEAEVDPGRLLLTLKARRSLTVLFALLGMGLAIGPIASKVPYGGTPSQWVLVLPPGRRRDPAP